MEILVEKVHKDAVIPEYKTDGAVCFDFYLNEDYLFRAKETKIIKSGLKFQLPKGYKLDIFLRSSIAANTPLILKNSVGKIDNDYRKEVGFIITNLSNNDIFLKKGERICQGEVNEYKQFTILESQIEDNERGGFGSTGK